MTDRRRRTDRVTTGAPGSLSSFPKKFRQKFGNVYELR